ncbi:COQ9 family protein [Candidatus Bodocaedibacter vickermanii]|uniref:COQ9 family protein n=1 Tax=Candidatus Bodocaedibacter vickermanii TaxID=2741701 RepID=A0A7L9RUC6_9PROT|nr:COQ9 family protein [Candidatus Paracaedibacteraceae bacterium 'Lake Konstanz']
MHTSESILKSILQMSPFPGWNAAALHAALSDSISRLEFDLLFPNGTESLISAYHAYLVTLLSESILELSIDLGTTAKIRWMMHTHFEHILRHSEAERAALSELYHPSIAITAPAYVGQLTDVMWRAAGDESTDMNYYTKRISLGTVYVATLVYWHTSSAPIDGVMQFFDDRLDNLKSVTKGAKEYAPSPDNIMKNVRLLKAVFWDK